MSSTMADSARPQSIAWNRVLTASLVAIGGAIVANLIIYFIAAALGIMAQIAANPQTGRGIGVPEVAIATLTGGIGAAIVFALLNRFTRRPVTIFRVVALIVLIASFATPFTLPGIPLAAIVVLEIMHIVAAAIIVYVLTSWSRAR